MSDARRSEMGEEKGAGARHRACGRDGQTLFVDAAGVRLRALVEGEREGAGRSVLVLHGFTGDAESMAGVAGALRADRRVARLELVGHGGSAAPATLESYSMPACAAQIAAAAEGLELGRPHLIGYSMGGRAALAAALASPGRFASLALVGATAGLADPTERAARIAADRALADRIEREGVERFVEAWMALSLFASQAARLGDEALARARDQRRRNVARPLAQSLRGMGAGAQRPLHDQLPELALPVLLVVGDEDEKFRAIARDLEQRLPDARVAVLPDAGHAAHLEAPTAFGEVVRAFLAEVDARAGSTGRMERGGEGEGA